MANLDALARTALAAFRDGLEAELTGPGPLPRPLETHVVGYKPSRYPPFGSRLIVGPSVTGKFTTTDFVWSGRARFWISVGLNAEGVPVLSASLTGFGTSEGMWPEQVAAGGNVAAVGAGLGRAVARHILSEHYGDRFGWA